MAKKQEEIVPTENVAVTNDTKPSMLDNITRELIGIVKKPLLLLLLAVILLLVLTPPLTYLYFIRDLSSKENIMNRKNGGVILEDRNGKPFFSFYAAKTRTNVPIAQIPESMQHAVIASEDRDFYVNPGFSLRGIFRSFFIDVTKQQLAQGGSTITQQLVKNTLLSQNKSFLRKYQEIFLALEVDRRFSKQDILEMYLNTVYFGEGAFGVEDAAQTYFGKHASQLTIGESALLAGILPAPSAYSPISGDKNKAFQEQKLVLSEMQQQGYLTKQQQLDAESQKILFSSTQSDINQVAPHFALMVKDELIKKYGEQTLAQSGFTVRTTLDLDGQEFAENTVRNQVVNLNSSNVSNGAAVVVDPKTGEILALVGSWNWDDKNNGKINMATHPRQPGSSFKPIVYAKAIDMRLLTPGSILDDSKTIFPGGYEPKDYDKKYRGKVTVRRALANSLNIPAVETIQKIGVPAALSMAEQLGIDTLGTDPSQYGLSLVLGAGEVPLVEMTDAYAVFADQGVRNAPTTILQITDKNGSSMYSYTPQPETVLDPRVAFLISSILSDNTTRAEEFGNLLTISRQAAVKTGTTEDFRDSLTLGYTPSLTVGVWVGNNDNAAMSSIAGSIGAAPIWRALMEHFLAGTPVERFIEPAGIVSEKICKELGLRVPDNVATSSAYPEFFIQGTEPTQDCGAVAIPSLTSKPTPSLSPTNSQPTPTKGQEPTTKPTDTQGPTDTIIPTEKPGPTIQVTIPVFNP